MIDSVLGPCLSQSIVSIFEEWDNTFPFGKSYSVSGAEGNAAFDHDIQG